MKKLVVFVLLIVSSSLFAIGSGLSVYGLYDFTNKVDVSMSGLDYSYNYKAAPGVGISYSSLSRDFGFSVDCAYYFSRTIDSGTLFGITAPFNSNQTSFSQLIPQVNVLFKLNEQLVLFGGANYSLITLTNTSAKVNGGLGYQGGVTLGLDPFALRLAYQVLNGTLVSEGGTSSSKFTSSGVIASAIFSF